MNAVTKEQLKFRTMKHADVDELMEIEPRAYTIAWSEGIVRDCIQAGYECQIARLDGELVAYAFASIAAGEAHLLNITVKPEMQGLGFGRRMLLHMLDLIQAQHVDTVYLEVRPSNKPARKLYRSVGFDQIGIRKGYYPDPQGREDAMVYQLLMFDAV
ncbi:MAG: ribosomal protein S18-alanine N-acetyltransferase [Gammaproteobacteria bacterium]|nr:ribosomal protein S18-alanine N-acetyltransferase [Gammaproteobacteria bacterium]